MYQLFKTSSSIIQISLCNILRTKTTNSNAAMATQRRGGAFFEGAIEEEECEGGEREAASLRVRQEKALAVT